MGCNNLNPKQQGSKGRAKNSTREVGGILKFKPVFLTGTAMAAFALNSILCRLALKDDLMDPGSFTLVRLMSGGLFLGLVLGKTRILNLPGPMQSARQAAMPLMLALYAFLFSLAYVRLETGTGALILFGSVQAATMVGAAASGDRPGPFQITGMTLSMAGLFWLFMPGLAMPSFTAGICMAGAGGAWGIYTLLGKNTGDPAGTTGVNFVWSLVPAFLFRVLFPGQPASILTWQGTALAVLSGALASGGGYVVWYRSLKHLSAFRAGVVQLLVPILASAGGILLLAEPLTLRLIISGFAVIAGTGLSFWGKKM